MSPENGFVATQAVEGLSFLGVLNDCLRCGVIAFDEHGRLSVVTPEALRILALEAHAVLRQPYDVLPAPLASLVHEALTTDRPVQDHDVELRLPDGQAVVVRVNIFQPESRTPSAFAVLNDVTSARRLEFDVTRLDRLANIGALSASMAHEIKNALVAVKTFLELTETRHAERGTRDGGPGPGVPGAEFGGVAQRELKRIESIVGQMLKFAGPSQPRLAPVRIHEILDHSLRLAQHQMTQKAIRLRRDYRAASDWVSGDDYQLEQAFVNLLLNAVEAMGVGGTLTLRTETVVPRATDPGAGSPPPRRRAPRPAGRAAVVRHRRRHRRRHFRREPGPPVRPLLHHQTRRHRPGPGHHPPHPRRTSRRHQRGK